MKLHSLRGATMAPTVLFGVQDFAVSRALVLGRRVAILLELWVSLLEILFA